MPARKIKYVPSHLRRGDSRKIAEVTEEAIIFTDGSRITYDHDNDCCEWNYADFKQLDDVARGYTFEGDMVFESVECAGFKFGDSRRQFFVPCYSVQNGYYSSDIDIYYNGVQKLNFLCEERF